MKAEKTYLSAASAVIPLPVLLAVVVAVNASTSSRFGLVLLTFVLGLAALGWGRLLGRAFGVSLPSEAALLLGLAISAHALLLPSFFGGADLLWTGSLLPLGLLGLRWSAADGEGDASYLLLLVAAFGFATLWSLDASGRYAEFSAGGPLRMWMDYFIHAGIIAQHGGPHAMSQGDIALAGAPFTLYHAGAHALAALPVRLGLVAPLDAVTAFWLPLGAAMTALGFLALGRSLAGMMGGAFSLIFLLLLPDAGAYWLRQGFLSFHWMMESSPGGLFALPVAMVSVSLLARWQAGEGRGMLVLSLIAAAGCFLLRAHIFVWLVTPLIATIWLLLPWPERRWRWALLVIALPVGIAALLWIARAEVAQIGLPTFLARYLQFLHGTQSPTGYDGFYPALSSALPLAVALPAGLGLALLGMAGVWLPLFVVGASLAAWRGRFVTLDLFPFALLGWATLLMILAPTPFHGDFTDFRHRGFVLVVAVLICWCARYLVCLTSVGAFPLAVSAGAIASLGAAALWLPGSTAPRMQWAQQHFGRALPPGTVAAARRIAAEARPGESFAMLGLSYDEVFIIDAPTVVLGMSAVPAYLSRPGVMRLAGPPRSTIAERRFALLVEVARETDAATALARLRAEGIGFLLAPAGAMPAWDPDGRLAENESDGLKLWRTSPH